MSLLNFNAEDVAPSAGFDVIPAGKYTAVITDSDLKPTKSGSGKYLLLEFEVQGGEYHGRKLWSRLNIENPNPNAVRMARADLSAICRAVNVLTPRDSVELHNLPLTVTVRCRKNDDGEMTNEIKSYEPRETAAPTAPPPQNNPASVPPWVKR